ncbi:RNB-domain-containing protein [Lojkania enalia]|uniref:RNB-domain-containing protein n=1 Tax=Lojkania enalia TaxID=147567 RepID=A0A9P4N710_9PLEO|nr:RNB-domain-containing protein [Didymosphaeria enalia]
MLRARPLSSYVCWQCRQRIISQHRGLTRKVPSCSSIESSTKTRLVAHSNSRAIHTTRPTSQAALLSQDASPSSTNPSLLAPASIPIRQRLHAWQEEHGGPNSDELSIFERHPARDDVSNDIVKLHYRSGKADESLDEERWDEYENQSEDLLTIGLFLKPGDVVEISRQGHEPILAVFVQQLEMKSQFFSVNGKWCYALLRQISFAIPGVVDPTLLESIIPYLPTRFTVKTQSTGTMHVPRGLATPVTQILHRMRDESERIYRENATVLDNAYSSLADKTRSRMMTLHQIAKALIGSRDPAWSPTPATLLAVRKALLHNEFRFRADARMQRLTNVFAIRPQNDVQSLETVHGWIREYLEYEASRVNTIPKSRPRREAPSKGASHIMQFLEKSRGLIAISRENRDANAGFVGPSKARFLSNQQSSTMRTTWGESFTDTDREIIKFLQAWVLTSQFGGRPDLQSACSAIIQAIGCYENLVLAHSVFKRQNKMGKDTGHLLLQEIGVISPHENRLIYDEQLMLPTVRLSRNLEILNAKAELTRRNPDFRDSMSDLRRDWGQMTVYCIDAADAQEIDDGVSIEKVDSNGSEFWVHVHVANPTAFYDKAHVLSSLAAHMTETVYTPERSYPMLPSWASQNYFSLGRNRPVLTFSAKVDTSGAILERKIQPGIIRKVIRLTPDEMAEHLGERKDQELTRLVVGGEAPVIDHNRTRIKLAPDEIQELRDLYTISRGLWKHRKMAGAIRFVVGRCTPRIFESHARPGLAWTPPSVDKARFIRGDPIIELTAPKQTSAVTLDITARDVVEELMSLACQTAGVWCAERNLPVIFRGTVESPFHNLGFSSDQYKKEVVNPYLQNTGTLPLNIWFKYRDSLGRAIAHSSSLPHKLIGAESYVKVTSPLRRFSDMIAHWQIEAALRHEARFGAKLNLADSASTSPTIIPFSHQQIRDAIITLSPRERIIQSTKEYSTKFWASQALFRAFHNKEAPLPDTFKVWIRHVQEFDNDFALGYLADYCLVVWVKKLPGFDFQIGDEIEAKLEVVNVFSRVIVVRPVGFLERER